MLLLYNERAAPHRRRKWIGTITAGEPTRLDKVFPDFATILPLAPLTFTPCLTHRHGSPSRGMHNDISAIKQLRFTRTSLANAVYS